MSEDRELLELAAKAMGVKTTRTSAGSLVTEREDGQQWNPLTDDGDALRLAVTLHLDLALDEGAAMAVRAGKCRPLRRNPPRHRARRR